LYTQTDGVLSSHLTLLGAVCSKVVSFVWHRQHQVQQQHTQHATTLYPDTYFPLADPARCLPFGGYVFLRFGKGNSDYSSVTSGMKNPIYVELTTAKSRKLANVPAKYQFVQDAMEQLTLCKYRGRPHW
jgi:hypothetical protein